MSLQVLHFPEYGETDKGGTEKTESVGADPFEASSGDRWLLADR